MKILTLILLTAACGGGSSSSGNSLPGYALSGAYSTGCNVFNGVQSCETISFANGNVNYQRDACTITGHYNKAEESSGTIDLSIDAVNGNCGNNAPVVPCDFAINSTNTLSFRCSNATIYGLGGWRRI